MLIHITSFAQRGALKEPSNFESSSQIFDIIEEKLWEDKIIYYDMKDIVGSPFLTEYFLPGNLTFNGSDLGNFLFRYNIYQDEIELKSNESSITESVKKIKGITIQLENNTLIKVFDDPKSNKYDKRNFFVVLADGDYKLVKKIWSKFSEPKEAENSLVGKKHAKFTTYENYFIANNDEKLNNFKSKIKGLEEYFPEIKNEIKEYVKEKNINLKKEQDLIKLFIHLNSLTPKS
ncbi:hypothetical protein GCM10022393_12030 [Aquimarina addita]|uniref:Uncharacterized protein n=2 Tax=Aquimarina addita TaxID=870485 RepID=A0ABP7XE28_9FLAO